MSVVTIDGIEELSVSATDYQNELRTLRTLSAGLFRIVNSLKRREKAWEEGPGKTVELFVWGRDIDGTRDHLDLIACFFHWFGVSACNYARLVGFIRGLELSDFSRADLQDSSRFHIIKQSVDAYVKSIPELADVIVWRNKVAAHFAITAPYKSDNISTLDMSVIFPVVFAKGKYRVNELVLTRTLKDIQQTSVSDLPCWSVSEVFDGLGPRFWPPQAMTAE